MSFVAPSLSVLDPDSINLVLYAGYEPDKKSTFWYSKRKEADGLCDWLVEDIRCIRQDGKYIAVHIWFKDDNGDVFKRVYPNPSIESMDFYDHQT